jgi:type IV secretory pathway VirB3-like protein
MDENYQLETDDLAVSLTKPPRQFGVPLVAYYLNCMLCFLGGMLMASVMQNGLSAVVLFGTFFLLSHITMALLTFRDPFGLHIFWLNLTEFRKHANFTLWRNTDSYSP